MIETLQRSRAFSGSSVEAGVLALLISISPLGPLAGATTSAATAPLQCVRRHPLSCNDRNELPRLSLHFSTKEASKDDA
jgi:hypothetical protein